MKDKVISVLVDRVELKKLQDTSTFLSLPLASFVRSSAIEKCNSIENAMKELREDD